MSFVRDKLSKSLTSRFLRTMKKKRPVLQDVADRVGVTKMTVSRFLRNPEQVSVAFVVGEHGLIAKRIGDAFNATQHFGEYLVG